MHIIELIVQVTILAVVFYQINNALTCQDKSRNNSQQ